MLDLRNLKMIMHYQSSIQNSIKNNFLGHFYNRFQWHCSQTLWKIPA